jgi:hypothetical protein
MGKSTAYDTNDAHDDGLQCFSKGVRHSALETRGGAMGREPKERKAVKERCRYEARSAYLFPNISPCSYRDRRAARP